MNWEAETICMLVIHRDWARIRPHAGRITLLGWSVLFGMLGAVACKQSEALIDGSKTVQTIINPGSAAPAPAQAQARDVANLGDFSNEIIAIMVLDEQLKDARVGAQLDQDDVESAIVEQRAEVKAWDKKRLGEWMVPALSRFDGDRDGRLSNVELAAARSFFISRIVAMRDQVDHDWKSVSKVLFPEVANALRGMRPKGGLYILYERVAIKCAGVSLPDGIAVNRLTLCQHIRSSPREGGKFSYILDTITANCAVLLPLVPQKS